MDESCALDVADRGGITLENAGVVMNLTRERIRQVETKGLSKIKALNETAALMDWLDEDPRSHRGATYPEGGGGAGRHQLFGPQPVVLPPLTPDAQSVGRVLSGTEREARIAELNAERGGSLGSAAKLKRTAPWQLWLILAALASWCSETLPEAWAEAPSAPTDARTAPIPPVPPPTVEQAKEAPSERPRFRSRERTPAELPCRDCGQRYLAFRGGPHPNPLDEGLCKACRKTARNRRKYAALTRPATPCTKGCGRNASPQAGPGGEGLCAKCSMAARVPVLNTWNKKVRALVRRAGGLEALERLVAAHEAHKREP